MHVLARFPLQQKHVKISSGRRAEVLTIYFSQWIEKGFRGGENINLVAEHNFRQKWWCTCKRSKTQCICSKTPFTMYPGLLIRQKSIIFFWEIVVHKMNVPPLHLEIKLLGGCWSDAECDKVGRKLSPPFAMYDMCCRFPFWYWSVLTMVNKVQNRLLGFVVTLDFYFICKRMYRKQWHARKNKQLNIRF